MPNVPPPLPFSEEQSAQGTGDRQELVQQLLALGTLLLAAPSGRSS
jgi:hypothetical protein